MTLNHRFAPDRGKAEAEAFLHDVLDATLEPEKGDTWELLDAGDGAPPSLEHPLLKTLVDKSGSPPKAKVGWTDVASFWEHGVPAANFGPGDPLLAHHPDERVSTAALERRVACCSPSSAEVSAGPEETDPTRRPSGTVRRIGQASQVPSARVRTSML